MVTVVYNIVQILLVAYIILPLLMTNLNVVYKESFVLIKLATYSPAGCGWGPSLAYWTNCSRQLQHLEAKEEGLRGPPAPRGVLECRTRSLAWLHCLLLDELGLLDRVCDANYSFLLLPAPWECWGGPLVRTHWPLGQHHCLQTPWHSTEQRWQDLQPKFWKRFRF